MARWTTILGLGASLALLAGCADPDCGERCGEAQDEGCDWIEGDCLAFCDAIQPLAAKAGCTAQADELEQCLADTDACGIADGCAATESGYIGCVSEYCAVQPTESECLTLDGMR
jgi:hypothetical protein